LSHAAVVYGYFPAYSVGDEIWVLAEPRPDADVLHKIAFPRQQRGRFLSIPDFLASKERCEAEGAVDVLPLQLVTMGTPIADFANELFAADNYRDYLRSEEHTSELQSRFDLVCRLLLEKKQK